MDVHRDNGMEILGSFLCSRTILNNFDKVMDYEPYEYRHV